ncbi:hypothetical protein NM04_22510 [Massilia aurea]|uniref:Uncharacterized protein n=1 Tax=Massilia aurea TaxID=373040 RepID=A0A422QEX0_9BURK|nr:hypothetical protein [Massilia aurea]RNF28528.1 hypothetical protein NM04_22510 [Massilia aurea]
MTNFLSHEHRTVGWLRQHWFIPLAIAIALGDVGALHFQDWSQPRLFESAVLFDFTIVLPLLYLWCYRARGTAVILPMIGLASLGIWATSHLIPAEHQHVLGSIGWLRTLAIAVIVLIEVKILFSFYKAVFTSDSTPEDIADKLARDVPLPPWLKRVLAFEARMLRRLAGLLKRVFNRLR